MNTRYILKMMDELDLKISLRRIIINNFLLLSLTYGLTWTSFKMKIFFFCCTIFLITFSIHNEKAAQHRKKTMKLYNYFMSLANDTFIKELKNGKMKKISIIKL
jgi:hypothetical protein